MRRPLNYPKVVGVRLSEEDGQKLHRLCTAIHRPAGDVLRLLIRLAEPTYAPPIRFAMISTPETLCLCEHPWSEHPLEGVCARCRCLAFEVEASHDAG